MSLDSSVTLRGATFLPVSAAMLSFDSALRNRPCSLSVRSSPWFAGQGSDDHLAGVCIEEDPVPVL